MAVEAWLTPISTFIFVVATICVIIIAFIRRERFKKRQLRVQNYLNTYFITNNCGEYHYSFNSNAQYGDNSLYSDGPVLRDIILENDAGAEPSAESSQTAKGEIAVVEGPILIKEGVLYYNNNFNNQYLDDGTDHLITPSAQTESNPRGGAPNTSVRTLRRQPPHQPILPARVLVNQSTYFRNNNLHDEDDEEEEHDHDEYPPPKRSAARIDFLLRLLYSLDRLFDGYENANHSLDTTPTPVPPHQVTPVEPASSNPKAAKGGKKKPLRNRALFYPRAATPLLPLALLTTAQDYYYYCNGTNYDRIKNAKKYVLNAERERLAREEEPLAGPPPEESVNEATSLCSHSTLGTKTGEEKTKGKKKKEIHASMFFVEGRPVEWVDYTQATYTLRTTTDTSHDPSDVLEFTILTDPVEEPVPESPTARVDVFEPAFEEDIYVDVV